MVNVDIFQYCLSGKTENLRCRFFWTTHSRQSSQVKQPNSVCRAWEDRKIKRALSLSTFTDITFSGKFMLSYVMVKSTLYLSCFDQMKWCSSCAVLACQMKWHVNWQTFFPQMLSKIHETTVCALANSTEGRLDSNVEESHHQIRFGLEPARSHKQHKAMTVSHAISFSSKKNENTAKAHRIFQRSTVLQI